MHEVALSNSLLDLILKEAARGGFTQVKRVMLEIGALSHVEPQALRSSFEIAAYGTPAEGAKLDIVEPAAMAYCLDCEGAVEIARRGAECPRCGGVKLMAQGGDEMKLTALEVS